jgi:acyl carrier protein
MVEEKSFSDNEIMDKIKEIAGKIVLMSPGEIADDASFVDDLGMESIDFLDIAFRLEESFGISLPRQGLVQRFVDRFGKDELVNDGKITPKGLKLLKLGFPEADSSRITEGMTEEEVISLVTAQTYLNLVKRGLEVAIWKPEQCDKCQATAFKPADIYELELPEGDVPLGPVFLCESCDNILLPPSFDEEIFSQLS